MDIIGSLQVALDITKKLKALNEKLRDADLKMLLADLQGEIADAKLEAISLKERIVALSTENMELRNKLEARSTDEVELIAGGYKFAGKGPYCIPCFETSGKKQILPQSTGIHSHFGAWYCPVCKNHS